ncbi:T9SS type A sorting domain-containing protein [Mucilaginibacter sp. E4BP6]|uniref:T9SS type A sorting domain-containing protein n=1 Tax=Mucilaginibacter sp. E4BP6 TaxID=2723089 RepID=UPI0015CEE1F5|nr:T9SS type A sorting domain-containing protein [Mucilaginibacter sp. E4BP6]NYE67953.1 hypothetical protein [Mucilaginibacter sp. E4BP6]
MLFEEDVINPVALKTRLLFLLVLLYILQCNIAGAATTYTWKGSATGAWNNAANWNSSGSAGYPGSNSSVTNDIAVINTNNVNITFGAALLSSSIDQLQIGAGNTVTITFSGNHTLPIATQLTIGGSSATSLTFAGTGSNLGVVTIGTNLNFEYESAFTVASGITVNFADGCNVKMNGNSPGITSPTINNSGTLNFNGSITGCIITGYYQELYTNTGTINATKTTWNFGTTAQSILNNTGTITMSAGSSITPGYQGQINNNSGGVFHAGITNSSCTINLSYQSAILTNAGTFYLGPTSALNLTYYDNQVTNTGTFTLQSDASGSATIGNITSGGSTYLKGTYVVQRYLPGGTGYRGYRLITLPVNINVDPTTTNQTSTEGFIDIHSLNNGMLTAGPGAGFSYATATTNPLMYLYDESRAQSFTTFISGKNVGIYSMAGSPGYTVTTYGTTTGATKKTAQVPVGTSVQAYFVGPNTALNLTATAPLAATTSATGYINQGTIPVYIYNTNSPTLSYNPATNNTPAKGPGLNQVGNPYPSTIDLDSLYFDNKTGGSAIGPMFWELKEPNNTFVAYSGNHTSSTTGSEAYIASGQGFFVQAISTSSALTFYEKDKVNVTIGTGTSPVLILNQKANSNISASESLPSGLSGLHLQIMEDTATYTQTGIYFNPGWNDKYSPLEDAIDLDGTAPKVYLSSYSSDGARLCINGLGSYSQGKTIKLYASATTSGTYTISLADINNIDGLYNVYLRDHKLNDSVNLRSTNAYTFTINTGDTTTYGANRFDLVVEREALPPYRLLTFTGQKVSSGVQLNWVASGTGNYTGFILEKKGANSTFSPLYTVQSSNNNSDYTFVDTNPVIGNNIYRLAQNDINGNVTYSSLITIGYNNVTSNGYFSVYPNPSKDMINILINSTAATTANYTADIYNTSGVLMDHRVLNTYTWTEDISGYKEGVYIIALKDTSGDVLAKSKFIKVK